MSFLNNLSGAGPSNYQKTAWNTLNGIGTGAANTGFNFLGSSQQNFQPPTSYYASILSGNPASVAGALSPEISSLQSGYANNRAALDQFAPMGGGRAEAMAQLPFQKAGAITNLISGARQNAAQGLTNIAGQQGGIGTSLLGVGANAAGTFGQQATNQNIFQYGANSALGNAIGQILRNLLGGKGGGGGGGGGGGTWALPSAIGGSIAPTTNPGGLTMDQYPLGTMNVGPQQAPGGTTDSSFNPYTSTPVPLTDGSTGTVGQFDPNTGLNYVLDSNGNTVMDNWGVPVLVDPTTLGGDQFINPDPLSYFYDTNNFGINGGDYSA